MQCFSLLGFLSIAICLNFAYCSSVYNMRCSNSSECAVYPNITQGPEWIWIPFFCNVDNICACPNGWIPFVNNEICIAKESGLIEPTSSAEIWATSFLVTCLLAVMACSCAVRFSGPSRLLKSIKNDKNLPPTEISRTEG